MIKKEASHLGQALAYSLIACVLIVAIAYGEIGERSWTARIFPDRVNLQAEYLPGEFSTLRQCKIAAKKALKESSVEHSEFGAYECALNCRDTDGGWEQRCDAIISGSLFRDQFVK